MTNVVVARPGRAYAERGLFVPFLLLSLLLASCSSQIIPLKGRIVAEMPVEYDDYLETLVLPGGDMVVVRDISRVKGDTLILERLRNDLSQAWEARPPLGEDPIILPGVNLHTDLRRREIRSPLFFDGTNIGLFYNEKYDDGVIFMLALFDSDNGSLLRKVSLDTLSNDDDSRLRGGEFRMAPDMRSFAVCTYSWDGTPTLLDKGVTTARLDAVLYSTQGDRIGAASVSIDLGSDAWDNEVFHASLPPPMLAAHGKLIQPVVKEDNKVLVVVMEPGTGRSWVVPAVKMEDEDEEVGLVRIQPITDTTVGIGASIVDGTEVVALSYTELETETATIRRSWRHTITEEDAEALVDDDLDDFVFEAFIVSPAGNPTFMLEYQYTIMVGTKHGDARPYYESGALAIFAFNAAGKLKQTAAFDKGRKTYNRDRWFLESAGPGWLKFITPRPLEIMLGVLREDQELQMIPAAEYGRGSELRIMKSCWIDEHTFLLVVKHAIAGVGVGGTRMVRIALP